MPTPTRTLSLHERYAVSRRCVSSPSTVSAAAILHLDLEGEADEAFETLRRHLEHRIDQALAQYPLLGYCVQAPRSKAPRWSPIVPKPTSRGILHTGAAIRKQHGTQNADKLLSFAILSDHVSLPKATDLEKGPLWKVTVSRIDAEQEAAPTCLVVLSTDHVINDGRGTLNLLRFLLQSQEPVPSASGIEPVPPASDKIFDFRPSAAYMLSEVWKELILPGLPLPKKLKAKLQGPISWPSSPSPARISHSSASAAPRYDIVRTPKQCAPTLDILLITAPRLITNLKALASTHIDPRSPCRKAASLHSILHTLSLVALYTAIARTHNIPSSHLDSFTLVLGTGTPISLREDARPLKRRRGFPLSPSSLITPPVPLPFTSGNYVSSYSDNYTLRGGSTFWQFTNKFTTALASPRGRSRSKQHMGLLSYIPDFERSPGRKGKRKISDEDDEEVEVESALGGGEREEYANGWEKMFGERAASKTPFDSAFTISNLGLLDLDELGVRSGEKGGWKVDTAAWAQSHTPQGEAFGVDILGFKQGEQETVSIGLSSRPSAFADPNLHQTFNAYLQRLVRVFAADRVPGSGGKISQESSQHGGSGLDLTNEVTFATLAHFLVSS